MTKKKPAIAAFDGFNADNDPYGEHDFGALQVKGERLLFKIEYYDPGRTAHSPDPADASVMTRVLTVMLALTALAMPRRRGLAPSEQGHLDGLCEVYDAIQVATQQETGMYSHNKLNNRLHGCGYSPPGRTRKIAGQQGSPLDAGL